MNIKMKIRPQFLDLIRSGIKTHEYRLADIERRKINVGDTLILVSNADPSNYAKVRVDKIEFKSDWDGALSNYWQEDFKGLFNTKEDVLKECYRFYSKQLVDENGIEVLQIRVDKPSYKNANYLFDTNTIIERESNNNVLKDVALVYKTINELHGKKYYHPKTKEEIGEYKGEETKSAIIQKLNEYIELVPSSVFNKEFEEICRKFPNDKNSIVDNSILLQVYNGNCDFLITSDKAIIQKAQLLYISDRVFTPNAFLATIGKEYPKLINYDVLSISLRRIGDLNINDNFFDSLREDYGGIKFNDWLKKKQEEKAYVFEDQEGLKGFLYLKTEDENEPYDHFEPPFKPAKRLKVGTFKIAKSGLRIGERFLKIIFDNAKMRNVDEIYVTMFDGKRDEVAALKRLMEEWGFTKVATNRLNGEIVLSKNMRIYDDAKTPKENFPLIKKGAKISILPIMSQYHTKLFPDLHLSNENMKIFDEAACRYAIEKIYVCNYKPSNVKPGDILCIYRMGDYYKRYSSVITGISILSEVVYPRSKDEFLNECKNKTVFTKEELDSLFAQKQYTTIIKLLFLSSFEKKINLDNLYAEGILDENGRGPRLDTILSEDSFEKLKKIGGIK